MTDPAYIAIYNDIRKKIETNSWQVGQKLPSERELAKVYNVSRMTLRQAIQFLVRNGLLIRRVGAGTFVASKKIQEKMEGVTGFSELIRAQGKVPSLKTVSFVEGIPNDTEKQILNLSAKEKIVRIERIRFGDKSPICFEIAAVPMSFIDGSKKEEVTNSLYSTIKKNSGCQIGRAEQTVTAVLSNEKISRYLEIPRASAILKLQQVSYLDDDRPFELVIAQYVGDRFEFYLERRNTF
ncbi:GntR family transcriptional regulator [Xylocopilactobacillus apis]|uniref:GntR family transcriptional regulator n=1 Tax=Xylocopilactobacillus apis TaxID=2932183 RepID=A0AAU9DBN9_9LACO|nr:GntR family transcriptional regulator [Xylocopilactobacillus apis]BDR57180.1 GntR family transcriptional regulator [Xylocopilactobacillus apis]